MTYLLFGRFTWPLFNLLKKKKTLRITLYQTLPVTFDVNSSSNSNETSPWFRQKYGNLLAAVNEPLTDYLDVILFKNIRPFLKVFFNFSNQKKNKVVLLWNNFVNSFSKILGKKFISVLLNNDFKVLEHPHKVFELFSIQARLISGYQRVLARHAVS
jgi:2-hydroxy-3-keto-5-methylthiopentenyl-1-phosphate phosphatase